MHELLGTSPKFPTNFRCSVPHLGLRAWPSGLLLTNYLGSGGSPSLVFSPLCVLRVSGFRFPGSISTHPQVQYGVLLVGSYLLYVGSYLDS